MTQRGAVSTKAALPSSYHHYPKLLTTMSKGKLQKFAEMKTFPNVFQYPYSVASSVPFDMKGRWKQDYFHNDRPIILELGCGKGEYTVGLARQCPDINFIGVDIKGARMYTGAKEALDDGLANVAFLRTNIEIIDRFFGDNEVEALWLTFSDPQMKNPRKRLSSSYFLERYRHFLVDNGVINLKTDSNFLFTYTSLLVEKNNLPLIYKSNNIHSAQPLPDALRQPLEIQTYYERQWMERGIDIKFICFRLPRIAPIAEPDVEIPTDEYRSYKRTQRSGKLTAK